MKHWIRDSKNLYGAAAAQPHVLFTLQPCLYGAAAAQPHVLFMHNPTLVGPFRWYRHVQGLLSINLSSIPKDNSWPFSLQLFAMLLFQVVIVSANPDASPPTGKLVLVLRVSHPLVACPHIRLNLPGDAQQPAPPHTIPCLCPSLHQVCCERPGDAHQPPLLVVNQSPSDPHCTRVPEPNVQSRPPRHAPFQRGGWISPSTGLRTAQD